MFSLSVRLIGKKKCFTYGISLCLLNTAIQYRDQRFYHSFPMSATVGFECDGGFLCINQRFQELQLGCGQSWPSLPGESIISRSEGLSPTGLLCHSHFYCHLKAQVVTCASDAPTTDGRFSAPPWNLDAHSKSRLLLALLTVNQRVPWPSHGGDYFARALPRTQRDILLIGLLVYHKGL